MYFAPADFDFEINYFKNEKQLIIVKFHWEAFFSITTLFLAYKVKFSFYYREKIKKI